MCEALGFYKEQAKSCLYGAYIQEETLSWALSGHHLQSSRQPPKTGIINITSQVRRLSAISTLVGQEETLPLTIPSHLHPHPPMFSWQGEAEPSSRDAAHLRYLKFSLFGLEMCDQIFFFKSRFTFLIMFEVDLQRY